MRRALRYALLLAAAALPAHGVTLTGTDWRVHFNLPDQNAANVGADEFALRDLLVARLDALQSNQTAHLATYTWSGTNLATGGSGAIMNAMDAALNRGARLCFVADGGVDLAQAPNGSSNSLAAMVARAVNPLVLAQDDSSSGIMHHKLGLFDYGPGNRWVVSGSWNFTGGASTFQWNLMTDIRNEALFAAYSNEFAELLAGRFHDHPAKSHAHDRAAFRLEGSWTNDFVRFAPYPDGAPGGTNALTDITNVIGQAEIQIVFALNQLTRLQVATALVAACDRGVEVLGVIALSDATNTPFDLPVYQMLTNAASYATTNRVRLLPAYKSATGAATDDGASDLIHAKWLVADPFGARPVAVHGSANWTDAALVSESDNDENLLVLHHTGIARSLYAHLKRITRSLQDRPDFWLGAAPDGGWALWATDTNRYRLAAAAAVTGTWADAGGTVTGRIGAVAVTNLAPFLRARRE